MEFCEVYVKWSCSHGWKLNCIGKQKGSYAFGDVFFEVNIYIQSYLA